MPRTSPDEVTSSAAMIETSPPPDPQSSTRVPGPMPAARNSLSVAGRNPSLWVASRSRSRSVFDQAYWFSTRRIVAAVALLCPCHAWPPAGPGCTASNPAPARQTPGAALPIMPRPGCACCQAAIAASHCSPSRTVTEAGNSPSSSLAMCSCRSKTALRSRVPIARIRQVDRLE